jgi:hypothetical protein
LFLVAGTAKDSGDGHIAVYKMMDHLGDGLFGECIGHHIIAAQGRGIIATVDRYGSIPEAEWTRLGTTDHHE